MKYAILFLVGLTVGCSCGDIPKIPCSESVCRPSWFGDCRCYNGAKMEPLPNGDVSCRCPK